MDDSSFTAFADGRQRPRVHIIGNGPSNQLFDIKNEYRVACNIPQHNIGYNCLSIIDKIVVNWMKDNQWNPRVPVLCTQEVKDHAVSRNREGHWFDVYEKKFRYSAGHHAVEYHAPMTDEVHMWGFDSIWTDDYSSQVDDIIPRGTRPNLNLHWIPHWKTIFNQYPQTKFLIHSTSKTKKVELGNNVEIC